MAHEFTIAADGDEFEKGWWPQWTRDHFPSYQIFWASRAVPLTYRVKNRRDIRFQGREELAAVGLSDQDVAVAQLHYTLLTHLGRVFEILDDAHAFTIRHSRLANRPFGRNEFFESFARLSGASNVADELLARCANPEAYDPWNESHGKRAREAWRATHEDPFARFAHIAIGSLTAASSLRCTSISGTLRIVWSPKPCSIRVWERSIRGLARRLCRSPKSVTRLRRARTDRARRLGESRRVRRAGMAGELAPGQAQRWGWELIGQSGSGKQTVFTFRKVREDTGD